jgi:APA family basic amino acid/polyamine antiporter
MVNIGTLSAFVLVSIGVVVLRKKRPDLKRAFKVPFSPALPIVSAVICGFLMLNLSVETWVRFLVWLVLGFVVFFTYSRSHSRVATGASIHHEALDSVDVDDEPVAVEDPA